ncbi:Shikimate kinase [Actinomyces bovis]|uniref:Shikimate kinase n=1 Tax=Actinomyces bovis TaxID=1658 RepID=A0ABY1VPK1_9ACTO|nr:shikimate kinase [Actinomyces bovis]SPT54056.1 Shikimate kinase [Actinomyces bovis]VEG53766.1 Shikimate kinase [Actinomyces israelii]
MKALVLLGPPGAGCTSVAQEIGARTGAVVWDLAHEVARELGVSQEFALVAVGEQRYREVEARVGLRLLARLRSDGGVLALGSGCLQDEGLRVALGALREAGGRVVALVCSVRRLASRNGLDAPRSIALGTVHHSFTQLLKAREAICRELADAVVDTTDTTRQRAATLALS